ncbi:sensor domain-containing protein [Rhodococcus gannanensis]|uniref:Sensor domain-containing protein n=1 Tax=Rhodococcus gannanensis TaxID=1960308 RepID=A0ABW4P3I4_9NOCA
MKATRATAALPLLALPLLTACVGDGEDTAPSSALTTVAAPTATTASSLDDAGLRSALLDVADLPVGFAPVADPVDDLGLPPAAETSESDRSSTDPAACADVLAPIADQSPGATARATSRFSGPDFTSIDTDAAAYPDAAAAFTAVQTTLTACSEYSGTDADGVDVTYRLGGLDQAPVGDASTAFRLTTTSEGFTMVSDTVIAVVGGVVVQVTATGQDPIDPAVLSDLARTAADNLRSGDS